MSERLNRKTRAIQQRGASLVVFTFATILVVIPVVGLAIDGAIVMWEKARLAGSIDAAALAAGRGLSIGADLTSQTDNASATAMSYFNANFTPGHMNTTVVNGKPTVQVTQDSLYTRRVTVDATVNVPLHFLRILGFSNSTVSAHGQASRRDVNIILVLDRSGSMADSCQQLAQAAQQFASDFVDGRDEIGLITFQATANTTDFPPSLYFKSSSPSLSSVLGTLQCWGGTNSPSALSEANKALQSLGRPGALSVVVFFSDGRPDAFYAKSMPHTPGSPCMATDDLQGIVESSDSPTATGTTWGVLRPAGIPLNISQDPATINMPYCWFYRNSTYLRYDVAGLGSTDFYGNALTGHWGPLDLSGGQIRPDTPRNIVWGALNAADNAARSMRQQGVLIDTIGKGTNIDTEFMERLANDPRTPNGGYNPSEPTGMYVYAPDGGQLTSVFQQIASQILRISQ